MSLYHLVSRLGALGVNKKEIVNRVSPELRIGDKKESVEIILHNLLDDASRHSTSDQISVGAKMFTLVTLIQIKHRDSRPELVIEQNFQEVRKLAGKLGGCIYISCDQTGALRSPLLI